MRIYLSGPMSSIPKFNAPAFRDATSTLRNAGHYVVSPVEMDETAGIDVDTQIGALDNEQLGDCLARDVKVIISENIDAVVLLPGWLQSKGARLEAFVGIQRAKDLYLYRDGELVFLPGNIAAAKIYDWGF